jgi:hypothetical protein
VRELYLSGLLLVAAAGSAGCSTRGVYEGIQQQEAVKNPQPAGQPAPRRPSYDEYASERRKANSTDGR